ncbi:MAG TPA: spermine synthase, partial [Acidobacteriota bacterium]|nr:spermine synthase [Acidobacteriota bacterium]
NPDWVHVEEFVHLPMLAHPDPRTIIVLGRGAGGVINEILKHNVDHVDYTEIDPLLIEVLELFSTPLTEKELRDPRVHARRQDGRLYLKRSSLSYDVIFSGFTNPATLEANRFFTRQFFTLARDRLAPDGILVFGVPGSLTYMTPELANLNALVLNTIESVYPFVRVIPGDGMNYYLASGSPSVKEIGAGEMMERAAARQIDFRLFTTGYLEYRLHERWLESFRSGIAGVETEINEDFSPRGVFYSMVYWNEKFSPAFNRLFKRCEDIGLMMPAILLTALSALFFLFRSRIKNPLKPSLSLCVISTGFAGMIFDLMLIFAFQIIFGYVFYWVGILVAAFMAGVMAGGLWMTAHMKRVDSSLPALIRLETALVIFAFSLPWVFVGAGGLLAHEWGDFLLRGVFVALSMASGVLVGAQFPLANREYLKFAPNLGKTAGLLYGADLFGGWIGGIIGGVALLPVLGLMETSLLVVMLKVFSLLILLAARNRGRIAAA